MNDSIFGRFRDSLLGRLFLLAGLVLVLRIPVQRIDALIGEREEHRERAEAEVRRSWGPAQSVNPPAILVPYGARANPRGIARLEPETWSVRGVVRAVVRRRGIFAIPLYDATLTVSATFRSPEPSDLSIAQEDIDWTDLAMEAGDALHAPSVVTVGTREITAESDGRYLVGGESSGAPLEVAYTVELRGAEALAFQPCAGTTVVELQSDWPHPKFSGAALPEIFEVTSSGFTASWKVRNPRRRASSAPLPRAPGASPRSVPSPPMPSPRRSLSVSSCSLRSTRIGWYVAPPSSSSSSLRSRSARSSASSSLDAPGPTRCSTCS